MDTLVQDGSEHFGTRRGSTLWYKTGVNTGTRREQEPRSGSYRLFVIIGTAGVETRDNLQAGWPVSIEI